MLESLSNKVADLKACSVIKKTPTQVFPGNIAKSLRRSTLKTIIKRQMYKEQGILYKEFVDISHENASFDILEDSIWLQFIYFFQNFKIALWPMKHAFRILCVL